MWVYKRDTFEPSTRVQGFLWGFLGEPKLWVPEFLELGGTAKAVCEIPNLPNSGGMVLSMLLDGAKLETTQTRSNGSQIAQATIPPRPPGQYVVECSANSGNKERALANITVYNFPVPFLESLDDLEMVGTDRFLVLTCTLSDAGPMMVSINITGPDIPFTCKGNDPNILVPHRTCSLPAKKEHNGKMVMCEAGISVQGQVMRKRAFMRLNIEFSPEFSDDGCPTNQMLIEGKSNVVLCKADGNPLPAIKCMKDGLSYEVGRLPEVTSNHSGEYTCKASNKLGHLTRTVTVSVQKTPPTSVTHALPETSPTGSSPRAVLSALAVLLCHFL
ncbi:intercellular adhesion molecule 1-like isoform X2 [Ambystoma mexicanum]|uniref:intercellular adhesion molecule 1-like isoform X2 n=1 Tax=Ambystoma mexicanum TaxID=8296 RepID=UPI0037E90F02